MCSQGCHQTSHSLKLLDGRAGEDDLRVQMRRGRGPREMESRGGWSALEKARFICLLKDGEGQGPSRFGPRPPS